MFKTTMPIFEQKEVKGRLINTKKTIEVTIDTSVFAEQRWEDNFPKQAEKETLMNYVSRIIKKKNQKTIAYVLSSLKAIYCFMKSSDFPDFETFAQNFNLTQEKALNELVDRMTYIFKLALGSSTTTPKNY